MNNKIETIINEISKNNKITFRLYNTPYTIKQKNQTMLINQTGINVTYTYENLKELLNKYIVYGSTLNELINDIKL